MPLEHKSLGSLDLTSTTSGLRLCTSGIAVYNRRGEHVPTQQDDARTLEDDLSSCDPWISMATGFHVALTLEFESDTSAYLDAELADRLCERLQQTSVWHPVGLISTSTELHNNRDSDILKVKIKLDPITDPPAIPRKGVHSSAHALTRQTRSPPLGVPSKEICAFNIQARLSMSDPGAIQGLPNGLEHECGNEDELILSDLCGSERQFVTTTGHGPWSLRELRGSSTPQCVTRHDSCISSGEMLLDDDQPDLISHDDELARIGLGPNFCARHVSDDTRVKGQSDDAASLDSFLLLVNAALVLFVGGPQATLDDTIKFQRQAAFRTLFQCAPSVFKPLVAQNMAVRASLIPAVARAIAKVLDRSVRADSLQLRTQRLELHDIARGDQDQAIDLEHHINKRLWQMSQRHCLGIGARNAPTAPPPRAHPLQSARGRPSVEDSDTDSILLSPDQPSVSSEALADCWLLDDPDSADEMLIDSL